MTPFERAVFAAGSQARLAQALGVTSQAISNWKRDGIPADRCPDVERVTGVQCESLRPEFAWVRDKEGAVIGYQVAARGLLPAPANDGEGADPDPSVVTDSAA